VFISRRGKAVKINIAHIIWPYEFDVRRCPPKLISYDREELGMKLSLLLRGIHHSGASCKEIREALLTLYTHQKCVPNLKPSR
jgi:hypothetical protein